MDALIGAVATLGLALIAAVIRIAVQRGRDEATFVDIDRRLSRLEHHAGFWSAPHEEE